jgi:hypothetical protein
MKLEEFKNIIREVVRKELGEQAKNWWKKPAEAEVDGHKYPSQVHEEDVIQERERRPSVGKKNTKRGARFTSAGTIPQIQGRKLDQQKVSNREAIGKKMLNTFRRGTGSGFRDQINTQLDDKGLPTDRKHQYSQIWANASAMAARGATAKDFPKKKKVKKNDKGTTNRKNEPSGETQ